MPHYVAVGNVWRQVTNAFVGVNNGTTSVWRQIKNGFVATGGVWRLFYSAGYKIDTPVSITLTTNSTTYLSTLTGRNYHWVPTPSTLTYDFLWSTDNTNFTSISSGSISNPASGSYVNTSPYSLSPTAPGLYVSPNTTNYYEFKVTASGGGITSGSSVSSAVTIEGPRDITDLSGTTVSNTRVDLSWSSSYGANRYMVWYKKSTDSIYTFFGGTSNTSISVTGLVASTAYNFYVVPWTGYTNSGSSATGYSGNQSNIATQSTYGPPVNTSQPYFQLISGTANTVGATYRLYFGSWSGTVNYYEYEIYYNNAAGTTITSDYTATYTQNYVDYTFNTISSNTIGAFVYAGNNTGGLSTVATPTSSIGPIQAAAPGAFSCYIYDSTPVPYWPSGAGINITGNGTTMTVSWNAATNADSYADQVSGVTNSVLYNTGANRSDTWGYSSSGYESATVYAYNTTTSTYSATIAWGAASGANSYIVNYLIQTPYGTGSASSSVLSSSTTSYKITNQYRVTISSVVAYSNSNGTGNSTTASVSGSTYVVPSSQSTSASSSSFYLTYNPPSAPTISASVTPTTGTAGSTTYYASSSTTGNPTPTVTYSWQYFSSSSFSWVQYTSGSSFSPPSNINTLYPNYGWQMVATATNSQGSASSTVSITVNSPAAGTAPSTPVVNSDNALPVGGTFSWSSATGTAPISYVFTVYGPSGSAQYSTNGAAVSTTSFRPGYDATWAGAGTYTIYVFAKNAYGSSGTAVKSQYMS